MSALKSDTYEWIGRGSPHEQAFRDGVERNGNAKDRCPVCDHRRLFRSHAYGYCDIHRSWTCWQTLRVACHICRLRWGVIVTKCAEADSVASGDAGASSVPTTEAGQDPASTSQVQP